MLKKFSLIVVVIVFAYSQVGYYLVLRHSQCVQKEAIKQKIHSQLKDEELEIISLTDNIQQIHWKEEGEFLFNDQMYDIVKRKTVNGKIVLYCINDKKEKSLIESYNLITRHNSSSESESADVTDSIDLFVNNENTDQYSYSLTTARLTGLDDYFPKVFYGIVSPPPKA